MCPHLGFFFLQSAFQIYPHRCESGVREAEIIAGGENCDARVTQNLPTLTKLTLLTLKGD